MRGGASPCPPPITCCAPRPHCPSPLLPQRYPISGYIKLPYALQPFVQLPIMDHVVVVAKPSGDVSGGLEKYREVRHQAGWAGWGCCLCSGGLEQYREVPAARGTRQGGVATDGRSEHWRAYLPRQAEGWLAWAPPPPPRLAGGPQAGACGGPHLCCDRRAWQEDQRQRLPVDRGGCARVARTGPRVPGVARTGLAARRRRCTRGLLGLADVMAGRGQPACRTQAAELPPVGCIGTASPEWIRSCRWPTSSSWKSAG